MRHRIGNINACTHLGNPDKGDLMNTGQTTPIILEMFDDALKVFFGGWGFDYNIQDKSITFGQEPAYMYENLKIVSLHKKKALSYIKTGHAFGLYGSGIRSRIKYYKDFRRSSKFVDFVDKWHNALFHDKDKRNVQ